MSTAEKRIYVVGCSAIVLLGVLISIVHSMLASVGLSVPYVQRLILAFLAIAPSFFGGVVLWLVIAVIRHDWRDYLRAIRSRQWLVTSALVVAVNVLTTYFYAVLKNSVPLLTTRNYDQVLWNLDRSLFFGLSPSVFFLNLLSSHWLLMSLDWAYGHFFFVAITVGYPIFLGHRRNDLRMAFFTGGAAMWSVGAWLYYAVPSLGPCYKFYDVWKPLKSLFPVSTFWQYQLMQNYEKVLRVRVGVIDRSINLVEGIAAFPSLHVGFHVFLALWLSRMSRFWGRVGWFLAAVIFIGSVVTGWHYLIDSLVGVVLGVGGYWVSVVLLRWMEGATNEPGTEEAQSSEA